MRSLGTERFAVLQKAINVTPGKRLNCSLDLFAVYVIS
jgi:hypothetical protein